MLRHVPACLQCSVPGALLDKVSGQARVRGDVYQQLGRPVREERLAAELTAALGVDVYHLHPSLQLSRARVRSEFRTVNKDSSSKLSAVYV